MRYMARALKGFIQTLEAGLFMKAMASLILVGTLQAQTPSWDWAQSIGKANNEEGYSVAVDGSGNVYVMGYFESPLLTIGSIALNNAGERDIFIAKYTPSGNLVWAVSAGGAEEEWGYNIAVDGSGNVYVTGYFESPTLTFGSTTLNNAGGWDIFVVKYNTNGGIVWAKSAGSTLNDVGRGVAVDGSGNVYITGYFSSSTLTFGSTTLNNAGGEDIFIVKYDANGNPVWAHHAGGNAGDYSYDIAVDGSGNVYVTGYFSSSTLTFGSTTLSNAGLVNIFVAKYNASGNAVWAKSAGGNLFDSGMSIVVDGNGNVYVSGSFQSPTANFGSLTLNSAGGQDIFVAKYDPSGNVLWAKRAGGSTDEAGIKLAIDVSGGVYVTGFFTSPTADFGSTILNNVAGYDVFVARYEPNGNLVWAISNGGSDFEISNGIAVHGSSAVSVYVTGGFATSTLNFGSTTLTNLGARDVFLAKLAGGLITGLVERRDAGVSLQAFPNPTAGKVIVNLGGNKIVSSFYLEVYNTRGERVYEQWVDSKGLADTGSIEIDLSDKPVGLYLLRMEGIGSVQVVVER